MAEVDRDRHAPADLQSEEARLRQRLSRLRLDMLIMQGDGNCQFRAVSFGLYGTEGRHAEVRSRAISFMKRNPAAFAVFLGEDYAQYLDSMARLGTWGDELTLVRRLTNTRQHSRATTPTHSVRCVKTTAWSSTSLRPRKHTGARL